MAYPLYLRQRACELRTERHLSLIEIADRLSLPKTTVYYWIKDLPLGRPRRHNPGPGNRAVQVRFRRLREEAYARGLAEYDGLIQLPTFRDFVVLYVAEGSKRNRNRVSIANSDAHVVAMAASWLRVLTPKALIYSLQYHADQRLDQLRNYWGDVLDIDGGVIQLQRKSNSGQLKGRTWRSAHGVMSITVSDTYLRARLQAWIGCVQAAWRLDSAVPSGRSSAW